MKLICDCGEKMEYTGYTDSENITGEGYFMFECKCGKSCSIQTEDLEIDQEDKNDNKD